MITALMAAGMPMTAFAKAGLALGYGDRVGGRHCHGCGLRGGFIWAEHPCAEGAGKYHENIDGARSHREQQSG